MKLETFFEKFEQFADATNAVVKMRELILQLAVQGKLVGRKVIEGDGHSLLKRLRKLPPEKNSKSRVPKDLPAEPEIELKVPIHWAITTVANTTRATGFFCDGDWVESKDQNPDGDVRLIQLADVGDGQYRDRSSRFMTKEAATRLNCSFLTPGDILIARMPDPLGRCCRFPGDSKPAVTVVDVCILRPNDEFFYSDFLVIAINNPGFRKLVANRATGTTRSRISRSNLGVLPIPIPPLAEQKRIVAKVNELMALCDRLEAQQQERDTRHAALAHASLARFADAPPPANLNFLFHPSYAISPADLRRSILTLAVQGKLVPQDPNEQPATTVCSQIRAERKEAKENRRISAMKIYPPTELDEISFDLPPGWDVARICELLMGIQTGPFGSSLHKSDYKRSGTPVINPASLKDGKIIPNDEMAVGTETMERLATFKLRSGDIVMARRGEMGRCAVVTEREQGWLCGTGSLVLRIPKSIHARYLEIVIGSPGAREYLGGASVGTTMQNLNQSILSKMAVGVPPIAEQRRIVAKVDQLMALVDQLEAQLADSRTAAINLMEAVVVELTLQGVKHADT